VISKLVPEMQLNGTLCKLKTFPTIERKPGNFHLLFFAKP